MRPPGESTTRHRSSTPRGRTRQTRALGTRSEATTGLRAACRTNAATGDSRSLFGFEDSRASSGLTANGLLTLRPARNMSLRLRYQYSRASSELVPFFAYRMNVSGLAGINGNNQDPRNWGPPALSFASDVAGLNTGRYAVDDVPNARVGGGLLALPRRAQRRARVRGAGCLERRHRRAGSPRRVRLHRRGHRPRFR